MLDALQNLVDLSALDVDLFRLDEELAALPARRAACEARRVEGEARIAAAREQLAEAEQLQRHAETEVQDKEALLAKLEGQQHQVKTNDAYTALLHEMDQAREAISAAETRILEAMEQIEDASASVSAAETQQAQAVANVEATEREIDARERALGGEIEQLRARRDALVSGMPAEVLARYQKIASRRRPAVAVVTKELCTGCRVGIPPQTFIEIIKGEALISCLNCHRILIHEDQLAAAAPA